jgi:hypothetical protein
MKTRFALFVYRGYYPDGGWSDLRGLYESPAAAHAAIGTAIVVQFYDIVDLDNPKFVEHGTVPRS